MEKNSNKQSEKLWDASEPISTDESISPKDFFIVTILIIAGISFLESTGSMTGLEFWKQFFLKLVLYGAAAEFIAIFWFSKKKIKTQDT